MNWVTYNEHDELVRAMNQIENLQAVVDAAVVFIHNEGYKTLKNLREEVGAFEENEL